MVTTQRGAFVTGAARGIGRAIAETLAAQGHSVAVADLPNSDGPDVVEAIEANGGHAVFVELDVTSSAQVHAAFSRAADLIETVDVLVNNAGWDELKPFLQTDEPFWQRVVDINYVGQLRTIHEALPGMIERRWGRIINIGSDAARVGSSLEAVYSGAKGAVVSFTKTLAREVAANGITANTVCPGPTRTPALEASFAGEETAKVLKSLTRAVPIGRLGEPRDVANAVAFLASQDAEFITGQTLSVSGGLTMA
jgi:2-hydroxycyclohexanecarboxyl-CoA dehydrogenase